MAPRLHGVLYFPLPVSFFTTIPPAEFTSSTRNFYLRLLAPVAPWFADQCLLTRPEDHIQPVPCCLLPDGCLSPPVFTRPRRFALFERGGGEFSPSGIHARLNPGAPLFHTNAGCMHKKGMRPDRETFVLPYTEIRSRTGLLPFFAGH